MKGNKIYNEALKLASKKRYDKALVWKLLNQSFEKGNPKAAYAIGTWFVFGVYVKKDYAKALDLFRYAADYDIAAACYDAAVSLEKGKGEKRNVKEAFLLYTKAALLGDIQSIFEVGRCYHYGIGVTKSIKLAEVWYKIAEKKGYKE